MKSSVRKPGRPADSRQAFSPARPGQGETDLGFSGQALEKPGGFMGPGGACRLSVYSISQVIILLRDGPHLQISGDTGGYLKMPADI